MMILARPKRGLTDKDVALIKRLQGFLDGHTTGQILITLGLKPGQTDWLSKKLKFFESLGWLESRETRTVKGNLLKREWYLKERGGK